MTTGRGDYIHTYTGRKFYALDPQPEDICIEDIAHALSNLCRFGGHSPSFYSVAEHSINVATLVPNHLTLSALLHDASEAYLCDIPRPFKGYLTNYKDIEARIMEVVATTFGLPWPMDDYIHYIDKHIVAAEANLLWGETLEWTKDFDVINGIYLRYSYPEDVEGDFLYAFDYYKDLIAA